jgi:hypothetical protein
MTHEKEYSVVYLKSGYSTVAQIQVNISIQANYTLAGP